MLLRRLAFPFALVSLTALACSSGPPSEPAARADTEAVRCTGEGIHLETQNCGGGVGRLPADPIDAGPTPNCSANGPVSWDDATGYYGMNYCHGSASCEASAHAPWAAFEARAQAVGCSTPYQIYPDWGVGVDGYSNFAAWCPAGSFPQMELPANSLTCVPAPDGGADAALTVWSWNQSVGSTSGCKLVACLGIDPPILYTGSP